MGDDQRMTNVKFEIRVYDKRNHPLDPFFWIISLLCLALLGLSFLLDITLPGFFYYGSVIVIGALRLVLFWYEYGPIGKVSSLILNDDSIHFFDINLKISNVDKIVIRLIDDRIQYSRKRNNYFEIRTEHGETYKFGVLINGTRDEKQIEGIITSLKPKIKKWTYKGYL